jgi:myosin-5
MEIGVQVWVRDKEDAWVEGSIVNKDEAGLTVRVALQDGGGHEDKQVAGQGDVLAEEVKLCNVWDDAESATRAVDDLISLTHLHEPAILSTLQTRFFEDIIYTRLVCCRACVCVLTQSGLGQSPTPARAPSCWPSTRSSA